VETKEIAKGRCELQSADPHKLSPPGPGSSPQPKPLMLVDVDGVISLFGDGFAEREGSFHSIDGILHFLSANAAAHLLALAGDFELAWCSGWEEKADEHLPRLLGVPPGLPFLRFDRDVGRGNAHWKLDAIDAFAGRRPLAWLDDAFNDACRRWAGARGAPTLLLATEPERGLTSRERERALAWARELRSR
jgi:hypothetical protein